MDSAKDYTVMVIGTGFGGSMTALSLAHKLKEEKRKDVNVLMLERGT